MQLEEADHNQVVVFQAPRPSRRSTDSFQLSSVMLLVLGPKGCIDLSDFIHTRKHTPSSTPKTLPHSKYPFGVNRTSGQQGMKKFILVAVTLCFPSLHHALLTRGRGRFGVKAVNIQLKTFLVK